MNVPLGVGLTFTGHNIKFPDGSETLPGRPLVAEGGVCKAALRDMDLAFRGIPRGSVRVADLGCLEGGYTVEFARAGYDATGFDVRAENIACCQYVAERAGLPNLGFVKADVRDVFAPAQEWDAVFCCGLLYHLDDPVAFLRQLGRATRRLLILQTHYSTRPDSQLGQYSGHWYPEGRGRWASWNNEQSFWLTRRDLMAALRDVGFTVVFEQVDYRDDLRADLPADPDERSMFIGVKV